MQNKKTFSLIQDLNKFSIYIVLIAMSIVMSLLSKDFLTSVNIINVLVAESARGLLAIGAALVIISGGIDLSVGSIVALSSVVAASLVQEPNAAQKVFPNLVIDPVLSLVLAVGAGIIIGILFGIFNGILVAYAKIPPFIATLGSKVIATGLALMYTNAYPVSMLYEQFKVLGQGKVGNIPNGVIVFIFVTIFSFALLKFSRFGKYVYAIGGNVNAARYCGINVEKNLINVYIIAGILASVAGILIAARTGSGNATLGTGYELDAIAAATVGGASQSGGIGTIEGTVAGIFILGILNNGFLLLGVSPYVQQVIKGLIIVGAVVFDMSKNRRKA